MKANTDKLLFTEQFRQIRLGKARNLEFNWLGGQSKTTYLFIAPPQL